MIKYSTSPIDETYTRMHIFLKSHFFYTNRPTVRSTQRNRKRFENTPQNGWRPGPDDSGEKMCKKTNSLWEECSRNQQQRKKWIGALIGLKVNILMLNRLKTFFNEVFFFPSDVKISFSLFQKPWSHFPLSVVTRRRRRFSKLAPAWIILKFSTGGNQA